MRTANLTLEYTNDNAPLALKEVESMLKNIDGIEEILFLEVIKSRRACRNSCGKELSEEQFDVLESDEEEAWFMMIMTLHYLDKLKRVYLQKIY